MGATLFIGFINFRLEGISCMSDVGFPKMFPCRIRQINATVPIPSFLEKLRLPLQLARVAVNYFLSYHTRQNEARCRSTHVLEKTLERSPGHPVISCVDICIEDDVHKTNVTVRYYRVFRTN
jgi:hypothetical protein